MAVKGSYSTAYEDDGGGYGVQLPENVAGLSVADLANLYNSQRSAGFSDEEIRSAADQLYGTQQQSDWAYLTNIANQQAEQQTAPAAQAPVTKTTDIVDDYIASIPESTMTVEDLYTTILGRPSDAGGKAFWEKAFGPTVDESEKADFLQAAKAELAKRPAEEQAALAPNLVDTTQTAADTTPTNAYFKASC